MVNDDDDNIDDRKVVFDSETERVVHVHRRNIVANVKGEWTRPTLLVASKGQTPVFCHGVLVQGPSKIVERPPGVHTVLHPTTKVVALDASGAALPLPPWAESTTADPEKLSDVELVIRALDRAGLEPEALTAARHALARIAYSSY